MGESKLQYFEYFLVQALSKLGTSKNDFSILKIQKLMFFTVAAQSTSSYDIILGESLFNDFRAYQYGPVEHTIYSDLKSKFNSLDTLKIDNKGTTLIQGKSLGEIKIGLSQKLEVSILKSIDLALDNLIRINPNLLHYSAFNLVELSHRWKCWSNHYLNADSKIPYEEIKSDNQYYFI